MPVATLDTSAPSVAAVPQRRFGRTEERVPVVGLGTGPAGFGLTDQEAIRLYHACLDRGVTYLDTAPGYARAHAQLAPVVATRRAEMFLATKCFAGTAAEAVSIHEQSLRDLGVDHVDLLYAHCVGSFTPDQLLAPDGVFAGLRDLRRRGLTRYIGFTSHHNTWVSAALLREVERGALEVDAVMLAMNYADRHTYRFEQQVLPLAERLGLGVACMKVYGGALEMKYEVHKRSHLGPGRHHAAFRYALGLPGVAIAVIGMYTEDELERNLEWARAWEPLTGEEEERLELDGKTLAAEWGAHFGEVGAAPAVERE